MKIILPLIFICLFIFSCRKHTPLNKSNHQIPRLELTINPDFLWSPDQGLYIIGENGIPSVCRSTPANYNQKWEYPATVSYYNGDHLAFKDSVGFRIKGNCSRALALKSIGLYWRREYGNRKLNYPLFRNSSVSEFKRLVLRNSGGDFGHSHIKDAINSQIVIDHANVEVQHYQPIVVYINNEYWGIHNLREMITPRLFQYSYNVDDDNVDILTASSQTPTVDDGSSEDFTSDVIYFLRNNDLADDDNYHYLSQKIDIASFIDYNIIQTYIGNTDWPMSNTKWWRDKTSPDHEKWRWILYDTDHSLHMDRVNKAWIGDLYDKNIHNENKVNGFFIFNHLIKNKDFKTRFLERYLYFLDNVYTAERTSSIISRAQNEIEPEYEHHREKWNLISKTQWNMEVNNLKKFYLKRTPVMRKIINELMDEL